MPVTIDDVATLAGVSTATVSRALRGLDHVADHTRQRVARAAELLDYVVDPAARSLAAGHTNTLGVVIPTIGRWAHARMLEVITDVAAEADMDVLPLVTTTAAAQRLAVPSHPFRRRVDGLVIVEAPMDHVAVARLSEGRPVVTVGVTVEDVDMIASDDRVGVAAAVAHLAGLGHRRIALLDHPTTSETSPRRAGWLAGMDRAGLAVAADDLVESQPTATGGAAAMTLLLERPHPPTAVVAASDEMALAAMEVARSRGIDVPGRLSVVGCDDQPLSQYIGLTTVRRDVATVARRATDWVVRAIRRDLPGGAGTTGARSGDAGGDAGVEVAGSRWKGRPPQSVFRELVATSLVVRSSTGPAPLQGSAGHVSC